MKPAAKRPARRRVADAGHSRTQRQRLQRARFVAEYLIDLNGKQAAIRAGYSVKTAKQVGSRLLTRVDVASAVKVALDARAVRTGITQDRVLEEVALLAFSDVTHYQVTDAGDVALAPGAPTGAMRAVQSLKRRVTTRGSGKDAEVAREVELRLWDKPGPLKLAGQHVGLFADELKHSGKLTLEQALGASRKSEAPRV